VYSHKLEAEDTAKRINADRALEAIKLGSGDLAEIDFTLRVRWAVVETALRDAFRCDGPILVFRRSSQVRKLGCSITMCSCNCRFYGIQSEIQKMVFFGQPWSYSVWP
jgi:hypothetical protein